MRWPLTIVSLLTFKMDLVGANLVMLDLLIGKHPTTCDCTVLLQKTTDFNNV